MFDRFLNTLLYSIFINKKINLFLIINYVNVLKSTIHSVLAFASSYNISVTHDTENSTASDITTLTILTPDGMH